MKVEALGDGFVGRVTGLHLEGQLSPESVELLTEALDQWLVLVVPDVDLDDGGMVELGQSLGDLEDFAFAASSAVKMPAIRISNLGGDGRIRAADDPIRRQIAGDALWHTDNSYRPMRARYSMLLARTLPAAGGSTEFCNTRAAYGSLPAQTKTDIEDLVAVHSLIHSRALAGFTTWTPEQRAKLAPVRQPLVMTNPNTGRRSLYLASHICEIEGLSVAETEDLVRRLTDLATQPQFVYGHHWKLNDLVIWDDRATMHRRGPYDDLHETRVLTSLRVIEPSHLA